MRKLLSLLLVFIMLLCVCLPDTQISALAVTKSRKYRDISANNVTVDYVSSDIEYKKTYSYISYSQVLTSNNGNYGYTDLALRSNGKGRQQLYNNMLLFCNGFESRSDDVQEVDGKYIISDYLLSDFGLNDNEAVETWIVFRNDNPNFYWLANSITISTENESIRMYLQIYPEYSDGDVRAQYTQQLKTALEEYVSITNGMETSLEKAFAIHNKLCAEISYATDTDGNPSTETWAHNIIGVFINKSAVCEGYAKAYQLVLNILGIKNVYVTGVAGGVPHSWNMIQLDDGYWYWVDATWNDSVADGTYSSRYFLLGNTEFLTEHIYSLPTDAGVNFLYALPAVGDNTLSVVTLKKNGVYESVYDDINAAFAAMSDAQADYEIIIPRYPNAVNMAGGELPEVNSILITGNFYDETATGTAGYISVDSVYVGNSVTLKSKLGVQNVELVDNTQENNAILDLKKNTVDFLGSYCASRLEINGEDESCVNIETGIFLHFYKNVNSRIIALENKSFTFADSACTSQIVVIEGNIKEILTSTLNAFTDATQINISSSVSFISSKAFANNTKIEAITVQKGSIYYSSVDGVLYNADGTTLIYYPIAKKKSLFEISDKVTTISANAFNNVSGVEKIYIPSTVTAIDATAFADSSVTILCAKDSTAHIFAETYGINYELINEFTYTFTDENGEVLLTKTTYAGVLIEKPEAPEKERDENYIYEFLFWEGYTDGMTLEADVFFTPIYAKKCEYVFIDANGNEILKETVNIGDPVILPEIVPEKAETEQYKYTFAGWDGYSDGMVIEKNTVFAPLYDEAIKKYTYVFYDADGVSVLLIKTDDYGTVIELPQIEPSMEATDDIRYIFEGWSDYVADMLLTKDVEFYPVFREEENNYTYTFYDMDGTTVLHSASGRYADVIELPDVPNDIVTDEGVFVFMNWEGYEEGMLIEGNIDFIANYKLYIAPCRYVFTDEYGNVIYSGVLESGSVIESPEPIEKDNTAEYTYTFVGWEGFEEGMVISENMTFKAVFAENDRYYRYIFYAEDGTTIFYENTAKYGELIEAPVYEMEDTVETDYVFLMWDGYSDGFMITEDVSFVALYMTKPMQYTYIFEDYDGSILLEGIADYGTVIIAPEAPTRYGYAFREWMSFTEGMILTYNIVFTAQYYSIQLPQYIYTFYDMDGKTVLKSAKEDEGTAIVPPQVKKTFSDVRYTYTFVGWTNYVDGMTLSSDISFVAIYSKKEILYDIVFKSENGNVLSKKQLAYGSVITAPAIAQSFETVEYVYKFIGWDGYTQGMKVSGNAVFTAQYERRNRNYRLVYIVEGEEYFAVDAPYGSKIELPTAPIQKGYVFVGWQGYTDGMNVGGNAEFVAKFKVSDDVITTDAVLVDDVNKIVYFDAMDIGSALVLLENEASMAFFDNEGNELTGDDILLTGIFIEIYEISGELFGRYTVVVKGDIDMDGRIGLNDFLRIKQHISTKNATLDGIALYAADYNCDGSADITDFLLIKKEIN